MESWLNKRFGRVRTKEERKGEMSFNFADVDWHAAFHPPARFPKGHIREYDPDGVYTYRDQNPRYK